MMPLVGGFSRGSPVSPAPSFRRCSMLTSIALIGSEDLAVKSHLNLFTHSDKSRFIDTHKTPYYRVKRCRERKINIEASERVNVDESAEAKLSGYHDQNTSSRKSGIKIGTYLQTPNEAVHRLVAKLHLDDTQSLGEGYRLLDYFADLRVLPTSGLKCVATLVLVHPLEAFQTDKEREREIDRGRVGEREKERERERERFGLPCVVTNPILRVNHGVRVALQRTDLKAACREICRQVLALTKQTLPRTLADSPSAHNCVHKADEIRFSSTRHNYQLSYLWRREEKESAEGRRKEPGWRTEDTRKMTRERGEDFILFFTSAASLAATGREARLRASFKEENNGCHCLLAKVSKRAYQPCRGSEITDNRQAGNTARPASRSDEALAVRVSVARIAPSLLGLGRGGSIPLLINREQRSKYRPDCVVARNQPGPAQSWIARKCPRPRTSLAPRGSDCEINDEVISYSRPQDLASRRQAFVPATSSPAAIHPEAGSTIDARWQHGLCRRQPGSEHRSIVKTRISLVARVERRTSELEWCNSFCADLRYDLRSSFVLRWCNRALVNEGKLCLVTKFTQRRSQWVLWCSDRSVINLWREGCFGDDYRPISRSITQNSPVSPKPTPVRMTCAHSCDSWTSNKTLSSGAARFTRQAITVMPHHKSNWEGVPSSSGYAGQKMLVCANMINWPRANGRARNQFGVRRGNWSLLAGRVRSPLLEDFAPDKGGYG
ncbi:hypothetical protein PR048_016851 [Dryococelus australis]|uniref:Uncharacterized protein n=1 Tax=Dryococelus australis TaxID=614101 RepID=A0ABQ9H7V1_9NEOP|nr:hypothetical protein PR048_016851 [Dryococelus australis]